MPRGEIEIFEKYCIRMVNFRNSSQYNFISNLGFLSFFTLNDKPTLLTTTQKLNRRSLGF